MSFPQSGHGTAEEEAVIWWTKTESKEEGVILEGVILGGCNLGN